MNALPTQPLPVAAAAGGGRRGAQRHLCRAADRLCASGGGRAAAARHRRPLENRGGGAQLRCGLLLAVVAAVPAACCRRLLQHIPAACCTIAMMLLWFSCCFQFCILLVPATLCRRIHDGQPSGTRGPFVCMRHCAVRCALLLSGALPSLAAAMWGLPSLAAAAAAADHCWPCRAVQLARCPHHLHAAAHPLARPQARTTARSRPLASRPRSGRTGRWGLMLLPSARWRRLVGVWVARQQLWGCCRRPVASLC